MTMNPTGLSTLCRAHAIELPGVDARACVELRAGSPPAGFLELLIGRTEAALCQKICGAKERENDGVAPSGFVREVGRSRLAIVASHVMRLDGLASEVFDEGLTVHKRIPIEAPRGKKRVPDNATVDEYRALRPSASEFIRVYLLEEPSRAELFPFQAQGVEWLLGRDRAILADDMGLGKTVQAITALQMLFNSGEVSCALVICPKSLMANWEDEVEKWAPELSCLRMIPNTKVKEDAWRSVLGSVHVLIANYEQVRDPADALVSTGVDVIVADEAHRIRNIGAQITAGVRRLRARRFWAMTGTPIERDVGDLVTILSTIEPTRFSVRDARRSKTVLRAEARPYLLRRLKSEVLTELPAVVESRETVELLPTQRLAYHAALRKHARAKDDQGILALVNLLRTICDYDPDTEESAKAERILELIEDINAVDEKAVVFSYLIRPLELLGARLGSRSVMLEGSMTSAEREASLRSFKSKPGVSVLLASSRVGGEGLTLVEANHVIFFNEWWNPSANAQARDRVVRIGQTRGVVSYTFKCRGTIEEALEEILATKSDTIAEVIDRLAQPPAALDEDLATLVRQLTLKIEQGVT